MTEKLTHSPEQDLITPIAVETIEHTASRIAQTSKFIAVPAERVSEADFIFVGWPPISGQRSWDWHIKAPEGARLLEAQSNADQPELEVAASAAKQDAILMNLLAKRAAWWSRGHRGIPEKVAEGITDIVELSDGERTLDIFNLSKQPLSEDEALLFEKSLQAVAHITNGKIFDRVSGVALLPKESFPDEAGASFSSFGRILAVNIDQLREDQTYLAAHRGELGTRYSRYFREEPSPIEIMMTHELGHAMDITDVEEAEKLFLRTDKVTNKIGKDLSGISAFDDKFGWQVYHTEDNAFDRKVLWRINDAEAAEMGELPLTNYGATNPREDFAEAFAVMALGGEMNSAPAREKVIQQTLDSAKGSTSSANRPVTTRHITSETMPVVYAPVKSNYAMAAYILDKLPSHD